MAAKFNKLSKIIIRTVGFFIGVYLGYLVVNLVTNFITIPKEPMPWDIIAYVVSSAFFAFVLLLLSVPIVKGILKLASLLEKALSKFSAAEITGGIIGLIAGLVIALLISFIFSSLESELVKVLINIVVYTLLGCLGMIIGRKYISQISIFSSKSSISSQKTILDTSAIIDGRILELSRTNFLNGKYIIANFVLNELRRIADSADVLKRNRGRRGLDIISSLQNEKNIEVEIADDDFLDVPDLDTKILKLAESLDASVITTDYNLNKVATVLKVKVINLNEISNAIKPVALPGEKMTVNIVKQGKDKEQGVGFLEDGTMIVVENGGNNVGQTVEVYVTTSLQTNAGRMIFTRIE